MNANGERRIGLLIGREWSWPSAFISEVEQRDAGVVAEFVKLGGTFMNEACDYDVIIDRMSHEIPYYRSYLKYAALQGVYVINDPFAVSADDRFFGVALAHKLGLPGPRTVILPNKRVEAENVPESFRNLVYPMDWQGIIDFVGVPAILKDVQTGGRRISHRVHSVDELIQRYDESDTLNMILQQLMESDVQVHCYVIGGQHVLPIRYLDGDKRYVAEGAQTDGELSLQLQQQLSDDARALCRAYGYDINMVEFVIKDGNYFVINPTNPVPELDINVLTPVHFAWCVDHMATFAIQMAKQPRPQFQGYNWHSALSGIIAGT